MKKFILTAAMLSQAACSTMNESLQLGAGLGAVAGAAATYAGHSGAGSKPSLEDDEEGERPHYQSACVRYSFKDS